MGFKVIETEEELRSAHSAGLLWWKYRDNDLFRPEYKINTSELVRDWRTRRGSWDSYILIEDE